MIVISGVQAVGEATISNDVHVVTDKKGNLVSVSRG